jgi:hypothetical protein
MTAKGTDVTGRDGYLVCQALAYAAVAIERLPLWQQEWSDAEGMRELLRHLAGDPDRYLENAQSHLVWRPALVIGDDR